MAQTATQFAADVHAGITGLAESIAIRPKSVNGAFPDANGNISISVAVGSIAASGISDASTTGRSVLTGTAVSGRAALAAAADADVVKVSGDQTVGGGKTFTSPIVVPDASIAQVKVAGLSTRLAGVDISLADRPTTATVNAALDGKVDEPAGWSDPENATKVLTPGGLVAPAAATEPSGTITDVTYTPDAVAPESTDLASIAWAADKAPTFTDPDVLPIGDWAGNLFDQTSSDGIRTTTNVLVAAGSHDLARQYGWAGAFWIDPNGDGTAGPYEGTVGAETEAWGLGDEWDMRGADGTISGVWVTGDGSLTRAQAEASWIPADMLVYANFGKGVLYGPSAKATPFLALCGLASVDFYPYTDPEFSTGGYTQCQYLGLPASGGEAVRRAASYCTGQRQFRARLDRPKPTGQVIELTAQAGRATINPEQAVGAAWAALIGGASFIIWFYQTPWVAPADLWAAGTTYSWPASVTYGGKTYGTLPQVTTTTGATPGSSPEVWREIHQQWLGSYNQGADYQAALAEFKARVNEPGVARALRSDSIAHTATPGVNTRVVSDGTHLYLLAQPAHSWVSGTSYTLNLPAGVTATSADVMWSGGTTAPVSSGSIAGVTFAKEYSVRVYRVEI